MDKGADALGAVLDDLDVDQKHRPRADQTHLEVIENEDAEEATEDGEVTKAEMAMMIKLLNKQLAEKCAMTNNMNTVHFHGNNVQWCPPTPRNTHI